MYIQNIEENMEEILKHKDQGSNSLIPVVETISMGDDNT